MAPSNIYIENIFKMSKYKLIEVQLGHMELNFPRYENKKLSGINAIKY